MEIQKKSPESIYARGAISKQKPVTINPQTSDKKTTKKIQFSKEADDYEKKQFSNTIKSAHGHRKNKRKSEEQKTSFSNSIKKLTNKTEKQEKNIVTNKTPYINYELIGEDKLKQTLTEKTKNVLNNPQYLTSQGSKDTTPLDRILEDYQIVDTDNISNSDSDSDTAPRSRQYQVIDI